MKIFKLIKKYIEQKNYTGVIVLIFIFLLGLAMFYSNFLILIIDGIKSSDLTSSIVVDNGIVGIFATNNIGLGLIGLFIIYFALIFIPTIHPLTQNEKDYFFEVRADIIYIRFRKYEFEVKKETFGPTKMLFKDKNGKFVSPLVAYQIYNYIIHKLPKLKDKVVSNYIDKKDIIKKLKDIRLITDEEKDLYIKKKGLKKKKIGTKLFGAFMIYAGLAFIIGFCQMIYENQNNASVSVLDIIIIIFITILVGGLFIYGGIGLLKDSNKKFLRKIKEGKMYIASVMSYDKIIDETSKKTYYIVKVWDGQTCIDDYFIVPQKAYNEEIVKGNLYVIEYKHECILDFISDYELNL